MCMVVMRGDIWRRYRGRKTVEQSKYCICMKVMRGCMETGTVSVEQSKYV